MSININEKAYQELIDQDIESMKIHMPDNLERKHIIDVLNWSIKELYNDRVLDTKNKVIITSCHGCCNWSPADTYGCGTYCDELGIVVISPKDETDDSPIPDCCPLLDKKENPNVNKC